MAEIELHSLSKYWGDICGVKKVDLHIKDEEFIVLLGPSGCGKTTTMRMIAGLTELSEGKIIMDGQNVSDVDARDRDVAMVFQGYALYPNMTIYENIRFPLRMRKVPKADHDRLINEAADKVQLGDLLDRKPSALSGGQRQRAALARALVREPRAFLMDEPLSNLDAKLRSTMRVQLKHLQKTLKVTTIYVTHDQIEAMTLADRVVVMNNAEIQQIGTPDEIYNDPKNTFVAGFIGSPPMNLITGELKSNSLTTPDHCIDGINHADTVALTIGIRPENLYANSSSVPDNTIAFDGTLFGLEPTGDQTILTVNCGANFVEIKEAKDFRQELDTPIRCYVDPADIVYFDGVTGNRLARSAQESV